MTLTPFRRRIMSSSLRNGKRVSWNLSSAPRVRSSESGSMWP